MPERDGRVFVVLQLDGGNAGINTVVPFAEKGYARHRQALRLPTHRLIKVNERVGLHPSLRGFGELLDAGRLAICQGVGYPNANRSHFESMGIWPTARLDRARRLCQGRKLGHHRKRGSAKLVFLITGGSAPDMRWPLPAAHSRERLPASLRYHNSLSLALS